MSPLPRFERFLRFTERYTKTDMVYLASGGSWLALSQAATLGISFVVMIAFGHLASHDLYGNYSFVLSLAALFAAFSFTGIGTALTQSAAKGHDGALRQGFKLSLKRSWILAGLALCVSGYYFEVRHDSFLAASFIVVALFCPFLNAFSLFDPYLIGRKLFAKNSLYVVLNVLFPAAIVVATLYATDRAIFVILAYFAANTLLDAVFYLLTLREETNHSIDPELPAYSANLSVMNVVSAVADKVDSIMVFILLGPAQLGLYAYAIALPEQIKSLAKLLTPLSLPRFAERPFSDIRHSIWHRIGILALGLAIPIVVYVVLAPTLFSWFFPVYRDSLPYTQWYALSILITAVTIPLTAALQAHKRVRELYWITCSSSIALIVMLPICTYLWGISGAIFSQAAYRVITAAVASIFFLRNAK